MFRKKQEKRFRLILRSTSFSVSNLHFAEIVKRSKKSFNLQCCHPLAGEELKTKQRCFG